MLLTYLKIALRTLQKNTAVTIINVLGLAMGITAFILIAEYIYFERSYNQFHTNLPHLYRVLILRDDKQIDAYNAPGFAPLAASKISGIDQYCRIAEGANLGTGVIHVQLENNNAGISFRENNFVYADGNFFELFTFPILEGDAKSLSKPNSVAISKLASTKYFGNVSALGKNITLNNQFGKTIYTVQLVYDDMPENSDFKYNFVFSVNTLYSPSNLNGNETWASMDGTGSQWLYTYITLKAGAKVSSIADQYTKLFQTNNAQEKNVAILQPMSTIHLGESLNDPYPVYGSLKSVYVLSGIAALILAIAWFNYINLSTAGAIKRMKEVVVRKVVGATKSQIIIQFISESTVINTIAFVLAFIFVTTTQMPYAIFVGKNIGLAFLDKGFWLSVILVVLVGMVCSSAYTAFILSSFNPAKVLKGVFSKSKAGVFVRKSLVVFQYSVSMILITVTIIVFEQWHYMQNKSLGLDANQLVVVRGAEVNKDQTFAERSASFEADLRSAAFVSSFSKSGNVPTDGYNFSTSGLTKLNPSSGDEKVNYNILTVDDKYLNTYSIGLAAGNNFTEEMCGKSWNEMEYLMLNESAVKSMGFPSASDAVGETVKWGEREFIVRGITRDYHHLSVHSKISPTVFLPSDNGAFYTLRLASNDVSTALSSVERFHQKSFPGNPFEYEFMDENFANKYKSEREYGILFTIASCLAVLIASLGLFGLAAYSVEQRTKEIGIRKVLGSSVSQILQLFSIDFVKLLFIAFLVSMPLAWWFMNSWLQEFSYRISITLWPFGISGAVTIAIALLTIATQVYKGAFSNPVDALRSE